MRRAHTTSASGSMTANVARSGLWKIAVSPSRASPSIAEPSNHSPSLRTSGRRRTGTQTLLTAPVTSANWSSTWITPALRQRSTTSFSVSGMVQQIVEVGGGCSAQQETHTEAGDDEVETPLRLRPDGRLRGKYKLAQVQVLPVS